MSENIVEECSAAALKLLGSTHLQEGDTAAGDGWEIGVIEVKDGFVIQITADPAVLRPIGERIEAQGYVSGGYSFLGVPNKMICFDVPAR